MSSRPPQTSPPDLQTLQALRTHLTALTSTLSNTLQLLSAPTAPLPHPPHLTASLNYASYHLQQVAGTLALAGSGGGGMPGARVYPLPNFGLREGAGERGGEAVLAQLLRTRLEEGVEGWLGGAATGRGEREGGSGMGGAERRELWEFAGRKAGEETEGIPRGWDYSVEEVVNGVGNVRTGIRRALSAGDMGEEEEEEDDGEDEEEDGEDENGGDGMEVDGAEKEEVAKRKETGQDEQQQQRLPPMPLEAILRFMTRGEMPRGPGVEML